MKKVNFEYGCRALGYCKGEIYVDENITDSEIEKKLNDMIEFSINFTTEDGYEPCTEIVYKKVGEDE